MSPSVADGGNFQQATALSTGMDSVGLANMRQIGQERDVQEVTEKDA